MRSIIALFVLLFAAACQPADPPTQSAQTDATADSVGGVTVSNGWASVTPGGVSVSAGYLDITNGGDQADRLVSASSPRAGRVSLHEMAMDGAVMQMRAIEGLDIPAGATVSLAQGGNHLMFEEIATPFADGETIAVTLHFEKAGDVSVDLPVRRMPAHGETH
ncbi:copper chaperone PCu(A)C [Terricaulis sp.]|uniref:copper chaperone PCu(A)C n=1 Tax=Terricaulis sp. TaxID=2768686 RepID=UPI00378376EE